MAHGSLGRTGQQFKELPLIRGLDGETLVSVTSLRFGEIVVIRGLATV
jgi:hypothetical protein